MPVVLIRRAVPTPVHFRIACAPCIPALEYNCGLPTAHLDLPTATHLRSLAKVAESAGPQPREGPLDQGGK